MRARVAKHFVRVDPNDKDNLHYRCTVGNCKKICNGSQSTNLTVHIKTHKAFYEKNIIGFVIDPKEYAIKRLKCLQNCAEIISINGRAFKSLSDSGFQKLIGKKLNKLRRAGYGKGFRAPKYSAVKKHIQYQAKRVKEEITKEVKGKFVALMVDTASRNNKTFLGLSLQYVLDGRVIVRCIGMSEIICSHSSLNIKNMIMHCLNDFGINIKQLISITTDNAAIMIAMIKRFNTLADDETSDEEEESDGDEHDDVVDDMSCEYDEEEPREESDGNCDSDDSWLREDLEDQAELDELLDDNCEYVALVESCVSDLAKATMTINGIRCAAHSSQLAVRHTIKLSRYASFIKEIRNICKFFQKPMKIRLLKSNNINITLPRIDCITRWSSLYRMVNIEIIHILFITQIFYILPYPPF